ncbi:MAG: hypothetical protein H0X25_10075 [Acidobacteriales bacterium]|nr:hypothetical protein [Terriglobales bacterium]
MLTIAYIHKIIEGRYPVSMRDGASLDSGYVWNPAKATLGTEKPMKLGDPAPNGGGA